MYLHVLLLQSQYTEKNLCDLFNTVIIVKASGLTQNLPEDLHTGECTLKTGTPSSSSDDSNGSLIASNNGVLCHLPALSAINEIATK